MMYTLLWIACLLIAILAAISYAYSLRQYAKETVHPVEWNPRFHWWRWILPAFVGILFSWFSMDISMSPLAQHFWMIIMGLIVPFTIIWLIQREVLKKRRDRIMFLLTLLVIMNVSFLTAGWAFAKRSQERNYNGSAAIVDWTSSSSSSGNNNKNIMKVKLQWTCRSDNYKYGDEQKVCRDSQILDCGEITKRQTYTTRDYDDTVYNSDSFLGCSNGGFDEETWQENGWVYYDNWADDDVVYAENNGEGSPYMSSNQPSMAIIADCYKCEIDKHSAGNLYTLKRNWFIIPGWIAVGVLCACSFYLGRKRRAAISKEQLLQKQQTVDMA